MFTLKKSLSIVSRLQKISLNFRKLSENKFPLPDPFEWMKIPAGKVTIQGEMFGYIKEDTTKTFDVSSFEIAKYPITNSQFARFIEAGGYSNSRWWNPNGWRIKNRFDWKMPLGWQKRTKMITHPVIGVSWFEAVAFCRWLSAETNLPIMLPSEQQWQHAAQGDTDWDYPWGPEFEKNRCNLGSESTSRVTFYEGDSASPFGVVDMSGNISEWCRTNFTYGMQDTEWESHPNDDYRDDTYDPFLTYDTYVLRGGGWTYSGLYTFSSQWATDHPLLVSTTLRRWSAPLDRNGYRGFRIANNSNIMD